MTDSATRAKEYLVYAPVGLAYFLRDTSPTFLQMFIARGRSVVAQHEHQIDAELARAKSVGQLTVMFGKPELEKRLAELKMVGETLLGEQLANLWPMSSPPAPTPARSDAADHTTNAPPVRSYAVRTPEHLAIDSYDALSASQVIERLDALSAQDLDAIATYELGHRNRKTILGRIEQLRASA